MLKKQAQSRDIDMPVRLSCAAQIYMVTVGEDSVQVVQESHDKIRLFPGQDCSVEFIL